MYLRLAPLMRSLLRPCFAQGARLLLFLIACDGSVHSQTQDPAALEKQWGQETIATIQKDFYLPSTGFYCGSVELSGKQSDASLMWDCGVQFSALNAAAKLDSSCQNAALSYADALNHYWTTDGDLGGYNPAPGNIHSHSDRYYDDSEWIVLDLVDLYSITGQQAYLDKAEETMKFVLSGEDAKLGGGIYWYEVKKASKNTCSNAPAIAGLLRLYLLTGKPAYLESAQRLYSWINATLQDPRTGLYYDNVHLDGQINKGELPYNTALMIRSNELFYLATGQAQYLQKAKDLAAASVIKFVNSQTGVINGEGKFSHLLLDALVELNNVDPSDQRWLQVADRCASYVHDHLRDGNGHYPKSWDRPLPEDPLPKWSLIDQASVARAYLVLAGAYRKAQ